MRPKRRASSAPHYGDLAKGEVWLELDEWLKRELVTEDGRRLRIGAACIDSGGHHTLEV
jgi:terminase, large subunit